MKPNRLITCLGALTMAFLLPVTASAGTSKIEAKFASIMPHHHAKASQATAVREYRINMNRASREELMTLLGMNRARANRVIENRPYRSTGELTSRHVMSKREYWRIRHRVTTR